LASDSSRLSSSFAAEFVPWAVFLRGRGGIILSFLWGLAEGALFFVVPDVLLSLVAVVSPRSAWRHILSAVLGAVCAGALMYIWAEQNPVNAHAVVLRVPFILQRMFDQVRSGYQHRGMTALFLGPLSGIPYKIYAIEAPGHLGFLSFVIATAPARAWRFILVCLLFGAVAAFLRRSRGASQRQLAAIHAVVWILFYGFYWSRIFLSNPH
jgi:membrane protein YqaA with SNARE-associated domain